MGCATGTVRYILFFFNFLLALAGLGILILGVLTASSKGVTLDTVMHGQLTTPAVIFAIVGGCIFIFAFFGCCGALRESHCMIVTYAVLLLTLFLLQVAVAVLAYTYQGQTQDAISNEIQNFFKNYQTNQDAKTFVDNLQTELKCCGSLDNKTPWATQPPVPSSCYPNNDISQTIYSEGCIPKLVNNISSSLEDIGRVAIGVGVVEVVGIVFSLCLASSIRRSELRGYA